jgi:hypothetical protein
VEVGRVCLINFGADAGKLCTIVDILDGQRVGFGFVLCENSDLGDCVSRGAFGCVIVV